LCNEKLHNSYYSSNIIRVINNEGVRAVHVARKMINSYNILVGKPSGKRSFGR
jgi:hypothetical protein